VEAHGFVAAAEAHGFVVEVGWFLACFAGLCCLALVGDLLNWWRVCYL
jgi:hypothetical protein